MCLRFRKHEIYFFISRRYGFERSSLETDPFDVRSKWTYDDPGLAQISSWKVSLHMSGRIYRVSGFCELLLILAEGLNCLQ